MFKIFKITPFLLFTIVLVAYAFTSMYLNNQSLQQSYKKIDNYQVKYTLETIKPIIKDEFEYGLDTFLPKQLEKIEKENKYIQKLIIKDQNSNIVAQSPRKIIDTKNSSEVIFQDSNGYSFTLIAYPEKINHQNSLIDMFSDGWSQYQILGFVLLLFVLLSYIAIGQFSNTLMSNKINQLSQEKDQEIADHKQKTNMLLQQSKLALMGEMISNIAHQWRQPLNSISLIINNINISKAFGKLDDNQLDSSMKKIEDNLQFMSKTIDDFRNFYKPNKQKEQFSIKESILLARSIVEAGFEDKGIALDINIDQDIHINGHKNEFSQVIVTLLENSKDALLSRKIQSPKISIDLKSKNNKLLLVLEDNAGGIDEQIISKIFDPYFTTKHKTQGTGLGLYIANMIIKSIDGNIDVSNTKDGVRFEVVVSL
jgi:signal transduction histidine kinase